MSEPAVGSRDELMEAGGLEALTGRIDERELTQEMRSSYLDYAMSVIVGRALPDVRDGLKPVHRRVLYAMHDLGLQPNRPYRKSRVHRRRGDGQVPPARRPGDLRHAGADGAGLLAALSAGRRPGELRLDRRRPGRRDALHRGPARPARHRDASRHRRGDGRVRPQLRRAGEEPLVLPARFPNLLVNGSSGIAVGMATNIPPHNLREVVGAVEAYIDNPEIDLGGADAARQGPGLPGRRADEPRGHPRRLRLGSGLRSRSALRPTSSRSTAARTRSSSPSSRSWSRRAATAA